MEYQEFICMKEQISSPGIFCEAVFVCNSLQCLCQITYYINQDMAIYTCQLHPDCGSNPNERHLWPRAASTSSTCEVYASQSCHSWRSQNDRRAQWQHLGSLCSAQNAPIATAQSRRPPGRQSWRVVGSLIFTKIFPKNPGNLSGNFTGTFVLLPPVHSFPRQLAHRKTNSPSRFCAN